MIDTVLQAVGLFLAGYLLLVGRNAWKQGELRQFLVSLAVVAALILAILGLVAGIDLLNR